MAEPPNHSLPARRPLAREEELPRMKIPGPELRQVIAGLVQVAGGLANSRAAWEWG